MSHVYLFSHVYVFLYLLNYITSLYWKLSENYKQGCRNDQPICKNKGRNESNELSSNNLRFFQNNLGLVFHTTYSCIFHSCYLLLHFPLPLSTPAISTPAFSVAPIDHRGQIDWLIETDRVTALPCPYALDINLWHWPMTLTFNPRRAMVMTHIRTHIQLQRSVGSNESENKRTVGRIDRCYRLLYLPG